MDVPPAKPGAAAAPTGQATVPRGGDGRTDCAVNFMDAGQLPL
ncbi:hypothetical protein AB0K05_22195 [Nonomuraea sp. NPDC049486]